MFKMFAQFVPSDVCNVFKLLLIICIGVRPVAEYKAGAGDRLPSSLPPTPFHTLEHTNIRAYLTISVYHAVPHNMPTSLPATQVTTSETPSLARSPSSSGQHHPVISIPTQDDDQNNTRDKSPDVFVSFVRDSVSSCLNV